MNVLDLFSGIGGFSLGLERAGMRTVAFCEIEPYCRAVLAKRWPGAVVHADVRELSLPHGYADVICGGFPCQDISTAGDGAGITGPRSGLWSEYCRLIEEIHPPWVLVENVSALRSRGLEVVLGQLAAIRYDAEWYCIPARALGAHHRRDRIWIAAYPYLEGQQQHGEPHGDTPQPRLEASLRHDLGRLCAALAHAERERQPRSGKPEHASDTTPHGEGEAVDAFHGRVASLWNAEPDVGRVANGVPSRVDRLRAIGNAVIPQIPEIFGRAILSWERAQQVG